MEHMEKLDGRKISSKAMEEIRGRAVQRVQAGESPEKSSRPSDLPELVSITGRLDIAREAGMLCVPAIAAVDRNCSLAPRCGGFIRRFVTKILDNSNLLSLFGLAP